jgi:hypothetical protein
VSDLAGLGSGMSPETFRAIAESSIAATEGNLVRLGAVLPPSLVVLRGDRVIGMVTMRPAYTGADGAAAVGEMSTLAAAAQATDVVLTWEKLDLHVLCGGEPGSVPLAVHVCWATRNSRILATFPFRAEIAVKRRQSTVRPIWSAPDWDDRQTRIPPVVAKVFDFCWRPLNGQSGGGVSTDDAVAAAAAWLRQHDYLVDLTV